MSGGDDSDELDADSVLRALAAAPPVKPPPRFLTAMVVRLSEAAPVDDQIASVRSLVEKQDGKLEQRDDGLLYVMWTDASRAAGAALEIRDALPETRIAIATGSTEAAGPAVAARIVERALALLARGSERVCVDESTAEQLDQKFEIEKSDEDGAGFVLVEPLASGTPALVNKVIGNYKIVRLLGTGGMGVVYLAEHVSLGRKAVIKFVQERLTKDTAYTQRFFTEAKTAASIRHPGIVDVFDYGKDERGRGYIVMELLEGESLRTRLRREKPLPLELAIALGAQMAYALAAAHTAGVIHRDLKPDNLFLVPDSESVHKLRAKVLDFGLAKVTADQSPGLTQSGNFVGTPLYMSPEQCRAKAEIDHRTDIYSLGCILYEMATGRPPFLDKTVGDLIIAHNTLPPTPPSEVEPKISPALERTILKALAKHPEDRFANMEAFAEALTALAPNAPRRNEEVRTPLARPKGYSAPPPLTDGAKVAAPQSLGEAKREAETRPAPANRKRLVIAAVVAVVAIGGSGAFFALRGHSAAKKHVRTGTGNPTIAVLQLDDRSNERDTAWLATALGEVVTTGLQQGPPQQNGRNLDVMTANEVARVKVDLGLSKGVEWTAEQLGRVRRDLGADYVIAGSYLAVGGQVTVDAKLYDTETGDAIAKLSETGQESELITLGARLSADAKRELGIDVEEEAPPPLAALPAKASVAKLYAEGLEKVRRFDLIEARDLFTKAVAEDPADPLAHSALSGVWKDLGYNDKAKAEAKLAFDNAGALPRESKIAIEAQYREANAQWDQALEAYKTLFEFFPTRIEYGLALAAVQTRSGDVKSAYATLAQLRKQPHGLGSDPRIELAEAKAAEAADDFDRMREHAAKAALWANKRGARQLRATALLKQGWAVFTQGKDADAMVLYQEARQTFTELGDRAGLARVLNNIAIIEHRRHNDTEATTLFVEALKIGTEIGDTEVQSWVLNNWGYVIADAGELAKAYDLYTKKLALAGERGDTDNSQSVAHLNIAEVQRWRGDIASAKEHCHASEDLLRGIDARRFAAFTAEQCGEIMRIEDDIAGAKKSFTQAISWAPDVTSPAESAEFRLAMARAELDDHRPAEAESLARGALGDLAAMDEGSQRVCATSILAAALLARGQAADAAKEIAATSQLPDQGVSFACRFDAEITRARIDVALAPARKQIVLDQLEQTRARAASMTFVQYELAARLAIGELSGDKKVLSKLAKDADTLGFKLVARQAKQLAR